MLDNTYYPADFTYNRHLVCNVGIRNRGRGSRSETKPGLRIDFNRYEPEQEFLGFKSLVLKNFWQDPPMVREFLSMRLFRQVGLAAPREVYVRLTVNGEDYGLYLAIESIDKRFLQSRFQEDEGDLYEYSWSKPYFWEWLGPEPGQYVPLPFAPKTNEREPRSARLVDLLAAADRASTETIWNELDRFWLWDDFLTYLAVETYLGDMDGFLGELGTNNFYIYRKQDRGQSPGRFVLLPWDKDATLIDCFRPLDQNVSLNSLLHKAFQKPEIRRLFLLKLSDVAAHAGGMDGWLDQLLESTVHRIRPAAMADALKRPSNEEFLQAVEDTRYFLRERFLSIRDQLEREGVAGAWLGMVKGLPAR